jgi:hypothetical protein
VVDDEVIGGCGCGLEFEAELFLNGGEEGGYGLLRIVAGCGRRKLQGEIVFAGEAGFVDDRPAEGLLAAVGEREGKIAGAGGFAGDLSGGCGEDGRTVVHAVGIGLVRVGMRFAGLGCLQLWAAFRDDERIDGPVLDLVVRLQLESFGKDRLQHRGALLTGEGMVRSEISGATLAVTSYRSLQAWSGRPAIMLGSLIQYA